MIRIIKRYMNKRDIPNPGEPDQLNDFWVTVKPIKNIDQTVPSVVIPFESEVDRDRFIQNDIYTNLCNALDAAGVDFEWTGPVSENLGKQVEILINDYFKTNAVSMYFDISKDGIVTFSHQERI